MSGLTQSWYPALLPWVIPRKKSDAVEMQRYLLRCAFALLKSDFAVGNSKRLRRRLAGFHGVQSPVKLSLHFVSMRHPFLGLEIKARVSVCEKSRCDEQKESQREPKEYLLFY